MHDNGLHPLSYATRPRNSGADTATTLFGLWAQWLHVLGVLAASSVLSVAMVAARMWYTGRSAYKFMAWDLLLAWIPLVLAVAIFSLQGTGRRRGATLLAIGFLWLLFFPNSPYLLTDLRHLDPAHGPGGHSMRTFYGLRSPRLGAPLWYDVIILSSFAWDGLLLGFVSLELVRRVLRSRVGAARAWAATVAVLALSSFGVSLGRFERWNSWDLFVRPAGLLSDVSDRVMNPLSYPRTAAVTLFFFLFLLLAYLTLVFLMRLGASGADDSKNPERIRRPPSDDGE